jgi:fucose 4-O-acetylase-like acetyltransferase
MRLDRASSDRLALLRFPLSIGVVLAHTYLQDICPTSASTGTCAAGSAPVFAYHLISEGIAKLSVPYFFLLSGYLLFLEFPVSWNGYLGKLRSRVGSLLVPMLLWNVLALAQLALAQALPGTREHISVGAAQVADFGVFEYLNALLGLTRPPLAYQFWFIRDLIILVLLSPVIWLGLRTVPRLFVTGMFALWFLDAWPVDIPSVRGVAFFAAGAWMGCRGFSLFALDRYGVAFSAAYPLLLFADALTKGAGFNPWLHDIGVLAGLPAMLFLSGKLLHVAWARKALLLASGSSFLVFAGHEPLLTDMRKILGMLFRPESDSMVLAVYFLLPVVVIAMICLAYIGLQRFAPSVLAVLVGGRSEGVRPEPRVPSRDSHAFQRAAR